MPDYDTEVPVIEKKRTREDQSTTVQAPEQSHIEPPYAQKKKQDIAKKATQTLVDIIPCEGTKTDELANYWYDLIERAQVTGLVQQLAKHSALVNKETNGNRYVFELLLESVHKHLLNDKIKTRLLEALQTVLGTELKLDIKECCLKAEEQLKTPRRREIQAAEILQQEAVKSIYADPKVELIVKAFSAVIRDETIKPLNKQQTIH